MESLLFKKANVLGLSIFMLVHWDVILWVIDLLCYNVRQFISLSYFVVM